MCCIPTAWLWQLKGEGSRQQSNLSNDGDQGYRALTSAPGLRSHTYKTRCPAAPTSSQPFGINLVYKLQREFNTCVHQGKSKNSTMAFAAKRAASAGSPTATPDTKRQKESTSQKVGVGHPGHLGHLHFLEKSCCNMKTDHAAIPETPPVLSIPRGMPGVHHTTVRCGNRWDIPNFIAFTKTNTFNPSVYKMGIIFIQG